MKYTSEITINAPVEHVVQLFEDPDNLKFWQPGFISMEHLQGDPGSTGAKSKLHFKMGKREIEMTETILKNDLPELYDATYETKGVYNRMKVEFSSLENNTKTKFKTNDEFRFSGFMKLMAWLMPGAFKKQTQKNLVLFKEFVEGRSK